MRIRVLALSAAITAITAIAAPSVVHAQVRLPRTRPPVTAPQPLPPTAGPVAAQLSYVRSRWSFEGYPIINEMRVPSPGGGVSSFSTLGGGTHGDYRYTDRWSATADMTDASIGGTGTSQTFEFGTRFRPLNYDHEFRPLFDLRGGFMRMYDTFQTEGQLIAGVNGEQTTGGDRLSRGFGAIGGTGFEYTLTRTMSLMGEVSAMRSRMTAYQMNNPGAVTTLPTRNAFWMTATRFTIGLKFNPVHVNHLEQKTDSR